MAFPNPLSKLDPLSQSPLVFLVFLLYSTCLSLSSVIIFTVCLSRLEDKPTKGQCSVFSSQHNDWDLEFTKGTKQLLHKLECKADVFPKHYPLEKEVDHYFSLYEVSY